MKDIIDCLFLNWTIEEIRALMALLTLSGIIIGLVTFIIERIISSSNRKKDNRKKWLIDIIITPEIENINKHFEDTLVAFESSVNYLTDATNLQEESARAFMLKRAEFVGEIHGINKVFINTFVGLIAEYNKSVGVELKELITELTDKYSNYIGSLSLDRTSSIQEFSQYCNLTKAKFYRELFKMVDY